jgi:MOSC domain-containing protein YiiM
MNRLHFILGILVRISCSKDTLLVASFCPRKLQSRIPSRSPVCVQGWQDKFKELFDSKKEKIDGPPPKGVDEKASTGTVIRLAARTYDAGGSSKPSSRMYTTRKDQVPSVRVTKAGVEGDYNHYRTVALKSTEDRAVSILTSDVMNSTRSTNKYKHINEGDLGENILVEGVSFGFFRVGERYEFVSCDDEDDDDASVVVEITEPIEPCANLCTLPFINDGSIPPRERIARCQDFIEYLDRFDGYRGWYAKVHVEGIVKEGATVSCLLPKEDS